MVEESLVKLEACMLEERLLDEQMLQYTVPLFTVCIVCLYDLNLYSCRPTGIDITSIL